MSERVLPAGWREVRLGDLVAEGALELGDGYRTKSSELSDGGYRIVRAADIAADRVRLESSDFVAEEFARAIGPKAARAGDVVLTTKGTVGRVAVMPELTEPAVYAPQLCYFRTRGSGGLSSAYLRYWLQSSEFLEQASYMQGNTDMAPYISLSDLRSAGIVLRPLNQQRAIAEVLGALDDKIAANDTLAKWLLAVINVEFSRLFGDRRLRVALGSLAEVVDCLHSKKPERRERGRLLLQLDNIRDDGLIDRAPRYNISDEDYATWSRRFEVRPWDFVITNVGRIGAVGRIPDDYVGALGRNMTGIRPYEASESGSFIAAALQSRAVRREIEERTDAGSVMGALNVKSIPLLRLPESTPHDRLEFHKFASPQFERADRARSESIAIRATRDALLPALMSGRLTVRDAEALAEEAGL